MKKIIALSATLIHIILINVNFCQNPFFYDSNGDSIHLELQTQRYFLHTNSNFELSDLGNCRATKIKDNYYTVDQISGIDDYSGIEFYTQGLSYNDSDELFVSKEITFRFKDNITETQCNLIYNQFGLTLVKKNSIYELVKVSNTADALVIANNLYETGMFVFCTPDFWVTATPAEYIPNDTYFNEQWYLHNTGQGTNDGKGTTFDADIDAPEAWELTKGDPSIVIAVIDNGVTSDHPDLPNSRQIRLPGSNFAAFYDGSTNPNDPSPILSNCVNCNQNHGNACAGIIAATQDNNEGITGIAPLCKIMPIKIAYFGIMPVSLFTDAIIFADEHDADVISNSWNIGGPQIPSLNFAVQSAINAGRAVIFCAGNTARHDFGDDGEALFPADSGTPNLLVVGASDRNNVQANYSPTTSHIDLVAPSHSYYPHHVNHPDDAFNIWTLDIPQLNYGDNSWRNNELDWPLVGEALPATGPNFASYTGRFGGTSAAAPMVAGVVALMKSVNPCLSVQDVIDILKLSSDKVGGYNYNYNSSNPGHSLELGYGKLNAYRAVQLALEKNTDYFDLFMKDNPNDIGFTGINGTGGGGDKSPDIWVRNYLDGGTIHQSPEFQDGQPCYVYVKVTNKSCIPSEGEDQLQLYWSKAATSSSWPENWDGSSPDIGNMIDELTIPALGAGESVTLVFPWDLLNPQINNTWNSCLLARIVSSTDYLTFFTVLADDITENNNVSIRNVTIVNNIMGLVDNQVLIGNVTTTTQTSDVYISGKPDLFEEAEVTLTFDAVGWQMIEDAGILSNPGVKQVKKGVLRIGQPELFLRNIVFPPKTRIPVLIDVHFLADRLTDKRYYAFEIIQFAHTDSTLKKLGTETFEIDKKNRPGFNANAGEDKTAMNNDPILIDAELIPEEAIYNWYDESDSLIYTGSNFLSVVELTQKYKLEIIRISDGLKDYDEVTIDLEKNYIQTISPVPASDILTIEYDITGLPNAYISIVNNSTGSSYNYILSDLIGSKVIDASFWQSGSYSLFLISEGLILEVKTIIILY
jgi:subtilisin family serine protease